MTFDRYISDILFIIVLYKKRISECESFQSIVGVLEEYPVEFFIYDNYPEYNSKPFLNLPSVKVEYVTDSANSGVSKAYNLGSEYAAGRGKKWLLLCDQDTVFQRNYFDRLYEAVRDHNPVLMAPYLYSNEILISPCAFRMNYGRKLKTLPLPGWNTLRNKSLLNSGLAVRRDGFEECGGYNDRIFLDFSDFDFIKRYKRMYPTFFLLDVQLEHHLESSHSKAFNAERFIKYCRSYRAAVHNWSDLLSISFIVLARTIRLSIRHRILSPIAYWFRYYIM
jgi:GT2 family glycosyltransferase